MKKMCGDYGKTMILYGIFTAAWLFCVAFGHLENHAVFQFPKNSIDDRILDRQTSTAYRYQDKFEKTLRHYSQFQDMYQDERSTAVPGLAYTDMGDTSSGHMVPQGICFAGDYMLITAYDSEKIQNSVIYVLSTDDAGISPKWEFRTTIVLPDKNHVGGITFDEKNIWIAKNTTGYLSVISLETIKKAVATGEESYVLGEYAENVYCGITASFVTWYQDRLWIGTYISGALTCYRPVATQRGTSLQWECTLSVPIYAQGITFIEEGEKIYMLLSTSYGRYNDSTIYLYESIIGENQISLLQLGQYAFPPMAEELVCDGRNTYILFESGATCYSTVTYRKCMYPVDRVCVLSNQKLLEGI